MKPVCLSESDSLVYSKSDLKSDSWSDLVQVRSFISENSKEKMKIKCISRAEEDFTRERSQDLQRVFHNFNPSLRPMERAVEYQRALNAVKLDKIFARPFIGAMDGHIDAVSCMAKNPNHLKGIFSGSMDGALLCFWFIGQIFAFGILLPETLWLLSGYCIRLFLKTICQFPGHQGAVRGLSASTDGRVLVSCGTDCTVRLWSVPDSSIMRMDESSDGSTEVSRWPFMFGKMLSGIKYQILSEPIRSFEWGKDTVISLRFNPGEPNILATSGSDRSITLYDLQLSTPVRKLIMKTKTNALCWNPMEPMNFTAANEDCNCYSYDARKLKESKNVHKDHVSAVMEIDYSPTGREFVTGSYDRTVLKLPFDISLQIRIFPYNGGHSREIYHTKRMQRVFCVKFTCDATYVVSGSDDTNLRLWKANASEQLGVIVPRERQKHEYNEALKKKHQHFLRLRAFIGMHRHLPKAIFNAVNLRRMINNAAMKKENRRRAHSAPGSMPRQSQRRSRIIKEVE
ncbi:hypothetical protein C5167_048730 [Papaver somniferum]|uniref:Uncharacterized protein n=1 Tax=Papaver somniferum TaxID=3469 RepID=A0A4Y7KLN4_PAPSO|nr:hypothetical protein C5167_048730 [Papaver somniferum]